MVVIKKLYILIAAFILLSGCGGADNESVDETTEEVEVVTEIISEQEHNITLVDNEDFKITLLSSGHERYENARAKDKIELTLKFENKQNRTFEMLIDELKLDGIESVRDRTFFDEHEIEPNDIKNITLTTYTEENLDDIELSIEEHIAGTILYSDHERSRLTVDFSEYINE